LRLGAALGAHHAATGCLFRPAQERIIADGSADALGPAQSGEALILRPVSIRAVTADRTGRTGFSAT